MKRQGKLKLTLTRVDIKELATTTRGAAYYASYGAYCSGSCNSCRAGTGCEVLAPSDWRACSNYY